MSREVFHIVHTQDDGKWHVSKVGGANVSRHDTKDEAVTAGRKLARELHQSGGLAQVVVHREDGSFETEHTYGDDPRRTPG